MTAQPGDILLFRGSSLFARLIRLAQALPWTHTDPEYACFTHVALLERPSPDGMHGILEATNQGIVRRQLTPQDMNPAPALVHLTKPTDAERAHAVAWAASQLGDGYDWMTIASVALHQLTCGRLVFGAAGRWVCSSLVASALMFEQYPPIERGASQTMPADLATMFRVNEGANQ